MTAKKIVLISVFSLACGLNAQEPRKGDIIAKQPKQVMEYGCPQGYTEARISILENHEMMSYFGCISNTSLQSIRSQMRKERKNLGTVIEPPKEKQ